MRYPRRKQQRCVLVVAGLAVAALAVPGLPAPGAAGAAAPARQLRLIAAQRSITLDSFGGQVYLDPGMWVAAIGSPLQFDVQRRSYTKPITITQIIYPPLGRHRAAAAARERDRRLQLRPDQVPQAAA